MGHSLYPLWCPHPPAATVSRRRGFTASGRHFLDVDEPAAPAAPANSFWNMSQEAMVPLT